MPDPRVEDPARWPRRAATIGAVLLGTFPLWGLPLAAANGAGFLAYLWLSNAYYGGARRVFGATLFPAQEFGIIPKGTAGLMLAAVFYGTVGAAAGWVVAAGVGWWRGREQR